jgi:prevent-host-death family protein
MTKVKVSELRQNLPAYLAEVQKGEEIEVTVHGRVIARIVPEEDRRAAARQFLKSLRETAKIDDIISPSGDVWNAERDRSRYPRPSKRRARS